MSRRCTIRHMAAQHPKKILLDPDTGSRLKEARERAGMTQAKLANLGEVSRFTQAGYESGATDPNTGYLRKIEAAGIDVPHVLFGRSFSNLAEIDWDRMRDAFEEVEFFCLRKMPACPPRYRWLMVAKLYSSPLPLSTVGTPGDQRVADFLAAVLDSLSPDTSALQGKPKG